MRTLDRADDYAARGKVLDAHIRADQRGEYLIESRISGSGKKVYTCHVQLKKLKNAFSLQAHCSCPVGAGCKHAAATLFDLMSEADANLVPSFRKKTAQAKKSDPLPYWAMPLPYAALPHRERSDMRAWDHWLDTLQDSDGAQRRAPDDRRFGLLLRAQMQFDSTVSRLLVLPAWMRPGKRRQRQDKPTWVAPEALHLDDRWGPLPTPPEGWPDDVASALATLIGCGSVNLGGKHWAAICARHEERALDLLLQHYPAFYERGANPLTRGSPKTLELQWTLEDDGSQRLTTHASGAGELLQGAGLWYIDAQAAQYGRVEGDARLAERLRYAPTLAPEHAAAVGRRLRALAREVPPPAKLSPPQPLNVRPTPVLHMYPYTKPSLNGRRLNFAVARVLFDYDGIRLPPEYIASGTQRRLKDSHVFEIRRDAEAERHALHLLAQAGAQPLFERLYVRDETFADNDLVFQPRKNMPPLTPEDCRAVLTSLSEAGFRIEYAADFPHDELLDIDAWHAEIEPGGNAWFEVSLGIDVGGERTDLLPVLRRVLADPGFPRKPVKGEKKNAVQRIPLDANRSVEIPLKRLRALIEPLMEWLEGDATGELRLHRSLAPALDALASEAQLNWQGGDTLRAQLELLATAKRSAKAPRGFKATLRPYQREGLAWLDFLGDAGLGGILADDMGLGKTVQVLAHILGVRQRKQLDGPVLVVAPTSLVGNWRDEAARFAPRLKVLIVHGPNRADRYDEIARHHLVITTYPLLPRDRERLLEQRFSLLVLDEAQAIKNPRSQAAKVVREIPADRRLAMTGTPLENHLGELWAQFDAVEPGLLGSQKQFTKLYRTPIEKHGDSERQQRLNRRVGPLLLRRRKEDVLTDLPAKNEIVRTLELEGDQRSLYETLRLAQHRRVQQTIKERGLSQAGIVVLDALLKLRQACCDPRLVKLESAKKVKKSAKLDALLELIDGLVDEGRRILLFSQFTEMLGLIETELKKRRIAYQALTGQTPGTKRTALVKRFQQGEIPLFLISLKAGGLGLNLTAADTVIHYDPWWNPAVEAQATDRAHRIGQDKPVFVYRLICAGTVEEKIQAMQARKADLARAVLEGGASRRLRFDEDDLAELFAPL